ncbi:MAG: TRL-like family protein [Granulosicoccus sp.]
METSMNKAMKLLAPIAAATLLSSCASTTPIGALVTDVTLPALATSASGGAKSGTSVCTSLLSLLASGDCSIEAAKANGGITEVTHVDWHANSLLGIFGTYTTTVYGN